MVSYKRYAILLICKVSKQTAFLASWDAIKVDILYLCEYNPYAED